MCNKCYEDKYDRCCKKPKDTIIEGNLGVCNNAQIKGKLKADSISACNQQTIVKLGENTLPDSGSEPIILDYSKSCVINTGGIIYDPAPTKNTFTIPKCGSGLYQLYIESISNGTVPSNYKLSVCVNGSEKAVYAPNLGSGLLNFSISRFLKLNDCDVVQFKLKLSSPKFNLVQRDQGDDGSVITTPSDTIINNYVSIIKLH